MQNDSSQLVLSDAPYNVKINDQVSGNATVPTAPAPENVPAVERI